MYGADVNGTSVFTLMENPLMTSSVANHRRGRNIDPDVERALSLQSSTDLHATPAAERLPVRAGECRCVRATRGRRKRINISLTDSSSSLAHASRY